MDMSSFDSMLHGVADAFGKSISAATKAQYYSLLGNLTEDQWRRTCEAAKAECEMFPKISEMRKISYQYAPPVRRLQREEPTVTVVCKCRNAWAYASRAEYQSMESAKCWECHTVYDKGFLEKHRVDNLVDLTGDEEQCVKLPNIAPEKIVAQMERQLQF